MKDIKYKDYTGVTGSARLDTGNIKYWGMSLLYKSVLVVVFFSVKPKGFWQHLFTPEESVCFWCPNKDRISEKTYGNLGKKSRGKSSNIWFELPTNKILELKKLTLRDADKFIKVTNKKLKAHLDEYLPIDRMQRLLQSKS